MRMDDWRHWAAFCLSHQELLTAWERDFAESVGKFRRISDKQWAVLTRMVQKIPGWQAAEPAPAPAMPPYELALQRQQAERRERTRASLTSGCVVVALPTRKPQPEQHQVPDAEPEARKPRRRKAGRREPAAPRALVQVPDDAIPF
jgi:hypothetical protein